MRKRDELIRGCMAKAKDDEMTEELWEPISRFDGRYEASSVGRVRRTITGRVRKPRANRDGYLMVSIRVAGRFRPFFVHRLVIEAFVGEVPDGMEVNHKDGDKSNNRLGNLEVVTHARNVRHALNSGLVRRGDRHYKAAFTSEQVREIRAIHAVGGRHEGGPTFAGTARRFGVTEGAVRRLVRGLTWKHLPSNQAENGHA